jgi:hypothetical protein
VEFERWIKFFELFEQIHIKSQPQIWVMPALQKQLVASVAEKFIYFNLIFFYARNIAFFVFGRAKKITEFAIRDTNVGCVAIAVYNPGYFIVWNVPKTEFVRDIHQFGSRCIFQQKNTFFFREPFQA